MVSQTFSITRRVEFHETDAAGLMHFSNFYRWMEVCEHEWFRALSLPMMSTTPAGLRLGWPRREASCVFVRPLRCNDVVRINDDGACAPRLHRSAGGRTDSRRSPGRVRSERVMRSCCAGTDVSAAR